MINRLPQDRLPVGELLNLKAFQTEASDGKVLFAQIGRLIQEDPNNLLNMKKSGYHSVSVSISSSESGEELYPELARKSFNDSVNFNGEQQDLGRPIMTEPANLKIGSEKSIKKNLFQKLEGLSMESEQHLKKSSSRFLKESKKNTNREVKSSLNVSVYN